MEPIKLTCAGPAYIIVPLSEDVLHRMLFNDLVDLTREGKPIDNIEDLEAMTELMYDIVEFISFDREIAETPLPDPTDESKREVFRAFHTLLYQRFKEERARDSHN